jgi:hypothetical protein
MSTVAQTKVDFAALEWQHPAPGVRFKAFTRAGRKLRLVEFSREFVETGWCTNGHAGYVLSGELEIQFTDHTVRFSAGDGIFIQAGETEKHRAHVPGGLATLILAEEE